MTHLDLNEEERAVLAKALDHNLSEITDEIAHTDTRDYREFLKESRETLRKIREMLH